MPKVEEEERDIRKFINVNKVAKEVRAGQWFAMYSKDNENNLLITRNFILNLNSNQFWKIQCKLECKKLGVCFWMNKGDLVEDAEVTDYEIDSYFRLVKSRDLCMIERTNLTLDGLNLYEADDLYVGVKSTYIEMLNGPIDLYQIDDGKPLVASGVHVISPVREIESDYLASLILKQEGKEQWIITKLIK